MRLLLVQRLLHGTQRNRAGAIDTETDTLKGFEEYLQDKTFIPKFIPKDMYSSNASFEFYPNFIKILFWDASIGVITESPTVAKAMRQIFEMLWSRLGDEYSKSKVIKYN